MRFDAGFSIVELLASTALTLLLTGGIVAVFIGSRTTQAANERFAQVQETGRLALDMIVRDLRAAGYSGCVARPRHVHVALDASQLSAWRSLDAPVRGYAQDRREKSIQGTIVPASDSDALLLRAPALNAPTLRLKRSMKSDAEPLLVGDTNKANWQAGDVALIHSCEAHVYFAVSGLEADKVLHEREPSTHRGGADPLNSTRSLGYAFRAGAEITRLDTTLYYIAPSTQQATSEWSLWRRAGRKSPEEVAPGVDRMQLQFGVDTNGDRAVDSYMNADAVTDWGDVRSVSIAVVVRATDQAEEMNAPSPSAGVRSGRSEVPEERVFSTIVTLRNYFGSSP